MSDFLTYKGKPLVRKGNTIYYGDMSDKYVVQLSITQSEKVGDVDLAKKVLVQLMSTDPDVNPKDSIVKKSEKNGLYEALDVGAIWLEKRLKDSK